MTNLLIGLEDFWDILTKPIFVIVYIAAVVLLMVVIVISVMVNEHKFSAYAKRLGKSADRAEQAERDAKGGSRFDMLKRIDAERSTRPQTEFANVGSLREFCEDFRNFAAGKLRLYYTIDTIREFVAGLSVSHILILQGMSGTGKTSLAYAFGEFVKNPSTVIPVQPMWKERSDLLGYYNEFTKRFNETLLLEKIYEANGRKDMYITILDEMNIARVEYYFAEFLSLLELPNSEARYLEVVSDKWDDDPAELKNGRVHLPDNMWFLGTANNDDSTFAISDKVYDRAMILNIDVKCEPFIAHVFRNVPVEAEVFTKLAADAVRTIPVSEETVALLKEFDGYLAEHCRISFGNRIMKQITSYLPVYVACGGEELDALDDILAKKILRKLETQNTTFRTADLEGVCEKLDALFGEGRMKRCLATVRRIEKNG